MSLKIYNTLTRKKEIFKPIHKDYAGIYSCGPTVYNYAHIGNLRTYIFNDFLKRTLKFLSYRVRHVMNITDVDDKTIKESKKQGVSLNDFTRKYEKIFINDLKELNIEKPKYILRATENIPDMVKIIEKLMKKGYAYKTCDGIYFSIKKFKNYGKLANLGKRKGKEISRISSDEYNKKNVQDFALWKFNTEEDVFWNTNIGKGRPGWHIECSAMSMKVLGEKIDIHTGGNDLIFPHHTNEIAQSEASTGKKFVNYWMHAGFLRMKDEKMSKSKGNILILKDIIKKGFSPMDYRYLCLTTHYREPLIFSFENLEAAKKSLQRLRNIIFETKGDGTTNKNYLEKFKKAVEDDLNIPKALQIMWIFLRDKNANGKIRTIKKMDEILGLKLLEKEKTQVPSEINKLAEERQKARENKDWKKSDEIRENIKKQGYVIEDTERGYILKKR
ncbi:cysteine--tRNA ligase [Candidatus Pacearchaeota archaeon CG10_big_fil_rev_8_21_14_0_10_34_12]|nr:MAG: cysteine--tRNA ligase [Candidatus Pacearchaeota archaeon CG10_big_fil_rev_8_21_14_0_10_34_12]